ncbi:cytochrome c oxidase subunit 8A, mitochondrial [Triplophysa dalaica]|uniref:cytochrome c oxidase subunit 8A, mitochondrial n=1 Tax=Triplophysa dalaica TaxID=1582913 RepID=UPI0024E01D51|nr:cytochrome c oxidase subunit 8A, mitochondrial [Triplophysa dalaica]
MSGLLRGLARIRTAPVLRGSSITQRANIATRPAKESIGLAETAVGLTMFTIAILGPAGWVLANLENYRNRGSAK